MILIAFPSFSLVPSSQGARQVFTAYQETEKPEKQLEFIRVQDLYNTIQLRLRNANRPPFEPGVGA